MKAIFGTMNIGQQVFDDDALKMLSIYKEVGGTELDTAYVYNDGNCETILGKCLGNFASDAFRIDTKANPRVTGRMDKSSVIFQLDVSLKRLGVKSVDIFFLHFPDKSTAIESTLEGCAELYSEGKFKELGVSNFPLSLVEDMMPICDKLNCPRPTVFEGVYNALSRKVEEELLPSLDKLNMRFYAYNPLAGGLLTGKYKDFQSKPKDGRFALRAKSYQSRYWKQSYFEAVQLISDACKKEAIPVAEAAYQWIANHSMLNELRGDSVIIGASKQLQLKQNIDSLSKGELPKTILTAFDTAWELTRKDAPEYFRFYKDGKAI